MGTRTVSLCAMALLRSGPASGTGARCRGPGDRSGHLQLRHRHPNVRAVLPILKAKLAGGDGPGHLGDGIEFDQVCPQCAQAAPRRSADPGSQAYTRWPTWLSGDPSVRAVLDMPFSNYILWAYPKTSQGNQFRPENLPTEYREMYDLTHTLLTTYDGTGKTFYLGNWEGDWHLLHLKRNYDPTPEEVQNMIAWVNNRQKAVDDAKRDTLHREVQVYCYMEVNRVVDAMQGKTRMTNAVLPKTDVDFVSYSSYNSSNGDIRTTNKKGAGLHSVPAAAQGWHCWEACLHRRVRLSGHETFAAGTRPSFAPGDAGGAGVGLSVRALLGNVQQRGRAGRQTAGLLAD